MADTLLKQREEYQYQLQQNVEQAMGSEDDTLNIGTEPVEQAYTEKTDQELATAAPEYDDVTRIMPPKQNG
jgi:hypothetical protein